MSYQVLARKWRPRNFEQVIGQRHIIRALENALKLVLTGKRKAARRRPFSFSAD